MSSIEVLIAGGGVAGVEALLGLREVAGTSVRLTLLAPGPDFVYRPMAVAEPFGAGMAKHVPLAESWPTPARSWSLTRWPGSTMARARCGCAAAARAASTRCSSRPARGPWWVWRERRPGGPR